MKGKQSCDGFCVQTKWPHSINARRRQVHQDGLLKLTIWQSPGLPNFMKNLTTSSVIIHRRQQNRFRAFPSLTCADDGSCPNNGFLFSNVRLIYCFSLLFSIKWFNCLINQIKLRSKLDFNIKIGSIQK